jgi:2-keto-4-pentenoate hydratase
MSDSAAKAAELLLAARRDPAKRLAALPEAVRPADRKAAYAIQQEVAKGFGAIGGWKVSPFGADAPPMCGALPASTIVPSPARISPDAACMRGVEAEVCVRMGKDLPPRATPYTRDEVIAAIATMHPVIEVLNSRYVEVGKVDMPSNIADSQSHGGLVYGPGIADWQKIDLATESLEQHVDGALNASRTGMPGGDLLGEVVWLANEGSVWAGGLKAGQFVTCGSWSGANRVGPNAKVRVKFSTVGEAAVDYAA